MMCQVTHLHVLSHPVVATMGCVKVTLTDTVTIPPGSEMEISYNW